MKDKYKKIIISILFVSTLFVIYLVLCLDTDMDTLQQFHRGNYIGINNNNLYFNLNLDNQSIEYYNGEYYTSDIQVLNDTILTTEIEPLGKCLLILEKGTQNVNLIFEKNDNYAIMTFSFNGNEFIKIDHH